LAIFSRNRLSHRNAKHPNYEIVVRFGKGNGTTVAPRQYRFQRCFANFLLVSGFEAAGVVVS
jgi:hypothetical protein